MVASYLSVAGGAAAVSVTNAPGSPAPLTFAGPAKAAITGPYRGTAVAATPAYTAQMTKISNEVALSKLPNLNPRAVALGLAAPNILVPSTVPVISCQPLGPGCDTISTSSGGATGVKGINVIDSTDLSTNLVGTIEPADQGLCAGNGYVVETNNLGEIEVFNTGLKLVSGDISLDTLMGLTGLGFSSGGDPSCLYDSNNGGHFFITQFVSTTSEASGGTFAGCFAALAFGCLEGIAVSVSNNPLGSYNTYFLNPNFNSSEPGYPYLLNDFAKIATTQDAFLLFYDEFPLRGGGIGGGFFNGAQEWAIDKKALEKGYNVNSPYFNAVEENMGLLPTPDGTCAADDTYDAPGITCWYQVIPAQSADPSQFDNSWGGSGFMIGSLDFYGAGDTRIAVFAWTGLSNLNSYFCATCSGIMFSGQLFSGVESYFDTGIVAPQKVGPIPLGANCVAYHLNSSAVASCPEGGVATNGDGFTQASLAQGQIWGAISTEVDQTYQTGTGCPCSELHMGVAYYVIGTASFDAWGTFSLTNNEYVTAMHEELEFPAIAAGGSKAQDGGNMAALITFSLSGNGGPTGANGGGFYPSTAYGRLTSSSEGLLSHVINIADKGKAPTDGFTEYGGYPGATRPRWGDYSWAIFLPNSGGKVYFATNYIQYPNCSPAAFLKDPSCGGTRDAFANWGTSVNFAVA
jgi:hypothetical protein